MFCYWGSVHTQVVQTVAIGASQAMLSLQGILRVVLSTRFKSFLLTGRMSSSSYCIINISLHLFHPRSHTVISLSHFHQHSSLISLSLSSALISYTHPFSLSLSCAHSRTHHLFSSLESISLKPTDTLLHTYLHSIFP